MAMVIVNVPPNQDCIKALWPTFKVSIEEKYGKKGTQGTAGEDHCMNLIQQYLPRYKICYNHSQDCVGQYFGIDLTCVSSTGIDTIDCKSGTTGLYWDREEQYWYITVKPDFFNTRKQNTHFMHVGHKGDVFVLYKKEDLREYLKKPNSTIQDKYGVRVKVSNMKDFSETNI
jgi:hypothetical protein